MKNLIAVFMNETAITIIALLLLSGAMAKSAQIPLHSWLPSSMEGQIINRNFILLILYFIILIYYLIFLFFLNLIDIYNNSIYFYDFNLSMVGLPAHLTRDKNGKFISKQVPLVTLPDKLKDAIIGDLLVDGHLRFTKKGLDG